MKLLHGDLKNQLLWCTRAQWGLLAALLLLGGGEYLFGIRTANSELDQAHAQCAAAQNELNQDQDQAKKLPRVELEIEQLRQRVARFDKTLPKDEDLTNFINNITRISQAALLKKLAWHLDAKPTRWDQFTELPIQFTFEGDFQSGVVEFLRGAEDMQRLTRVRKLNLTTTDARDGQVKAQLTMNIYFGEE